MEIWIWLLLISTIVGSTCPYTTPIGAILGAVTVIAKPIFCILCFFFAPAWWYGLIALSIQYLLPAIIAPIDIVSTGKLFTIYSFVFSHLNIVFVVLMYLSLFGII